MGSNFGNEESQAVVDIGKLVKWKREKRIVNVIGNKIIDEHSSFGLIRVLE